MHSDRSFRLRTILITNETSRHVDFEDIGVALKLHENFDTGCLTEDDAAASLANFQQGGQFVSAFRDRSGQEFYIRTSSWRTKTLVYTSADTVGCDIERVLDVGEVQTRSC